jgi:integrase
MPISGMRDKTVTNAGKILRRKHKRGPFLEVRVGSASVPIYRSEAEGYPRFFVAFYRNKRRIRRSFADIEAAKREARKMADMIQQGRSHVTDLNPHERDAYATATRLLAPHGIPLVAAVEEYLSCRRILENRPLLPVVEDYVCRNRGVQLGVTVQQAGEEFIKAKEQDGASSRYLYQLRSDVMRFAVAYPIPILQVKSHQIDEWLRSLGGAPRTRNTVHTSIRTFFSWAKSRSYLPKNEITEAEVLAKVKVGDTEAEIFTPEQMRQILSIAHPEMIPFIVLGAFAGLRAAETVRLDWSAIDLDRRIIQIRAGQAKTASRRVVPVSENLREWLLPIARKGLVVPNDEIYRKVTPCTSSLLQVPPHESIHAWMPASSPIPNASKLNPAKFG